MTTGSNKNGAITSSRISGVIFSKNLGVRVDPAGDRSYPPWKHPKLSTLWLSLFLKSLFSLSLEGGRPPPPGHPFN